MIGERLAEIRKDHGDNQDDLARKLNVSVFAKKYESYLLWKKRSEKNKT